MYNEREKERKREREREILSYFKKVLDVRSQINTNDVTPEEHPGPRHTYMTKLFCANIQIFSQLIIDTWYIGR